MWSKNSLSESLLLCDHGVMLIFLIGVFIVLGHPILNRAQRSDRARKSFLTKLKEVDVY